MARHRRLNKNLVAAMTVTGIILSVAIVAVATFQAAQKDPEVYVNEAREVEDQDPRRAMGLYAKAYEVDKEIKYLIEAARVAYEYGEIGQAIRILVRANAERPDDAQVLEVLLERYWELKSYEPSRVWTNMRDHSDKLLRLKPDSVFGLVCRAAALDALANQDPDNPRLAEQALRRAEELDPTNPRVVVTRVMRLLTQAGDLRRDVRRGTAARNAAQQMEEYYARAQEIMAPAWEAHPGNWELTRMYIQLLGEQQKFEEARAIAEQALADQPDDVDLQVALARQLLSAARRKRDELPADETNALLERATRLVSKALEAEPALYDAYAIKAQLVLSRAAARDAPPDELVGYYDKALDILRSAAEETVDLKSIRARLGVGLKIQMLYDAFLAAVDYYRYSSNNLEGKLRDEHQETALDYAGWFQDHVAREYPGSFLALLMQGELAVLKEKPKQEDYREAIHAFVQAEEKTRDVSPRFNRQANEKLAMLYLRVEEYGSALQYTDRAIEQYLDEGYQPPRRLVVGKVQLLNVLTRYQEALDLDEQLLQRFPDDPALRDLRIAALIGLGRNPEAQRELGQATAEDPRALLNRARLATAAEDYATAESCLRKVLDANPETMDAIRLYVHVMIAADRREEGRQYVEALLARTGPGYQHVLRGLIVVLTTSDLEERKRKLTEIIASIPDPVQRASEYYNYYVTQKPPMYEQALPYLNEVEKARPDDEAVFDQQFSLRMLLGQFDSAERYAVKLAERNADRAGGAVYRGRLALARGDAEQALREFTAAQSQMPGNSDVNLYVARAMLACSPPRFEEALTPLREALKANPLSFQANKLMFAILNELGRRSESIEYLQTAAKLKPHDPFIQEQSELLEEETDPAAGIARREALRKAEPQNVDNLVRLAELHIRMAEQARDQDDEDAEAAANAQAEECLQAALARAPDGVAAARVAARFYAGQNKRQAGEQFLNKHIAALQGVARLQAQLLLGRFYERLGDLDAAENCIQRCARAADTEVADEAERRKARAGIAFELVDFYRRNRKMQKVIEAADRALALIEPSETQRIREVRLAAIEARIDLKQYGQAADLIEAYLREFAGDIRGMTVKAQLLIARNDPDKLEEAQELLSRILKEEPENTWCLLLRGSVNAELGRYDTARKDLLKAKRLNPTGLNLLHRRNLAKLYETQQQYEMAEAEWKELAELQPDKKEFPVRLIRLYRTTDQLNKAQAVAAEYMGRQPEDPFWPFQLAQLLIEQNEYPAAVGYLRTAAELSERSEPVIVAEWIRALVEAKRAPEAVRIFESLSPEQAAPVVKINAAQAYLVLNQSSTADRQAIEAALEASDEGLQPLTTVCRRLVEMTSLAKGADLMRLLVVQSASNPAREMRFRIMLASCLTEANKPAEALETVAPVLRAAIGGSEEHVAALLAQARALERQGDAEAMVKAYEDVLALDKNNVQALNNLAYALADSFKRPKEALLYAEQLRRVGGARVDVLDTIGWIYALNGRYPQAESILKEALRLDPHSLPARLHLGQVLQQAGRIDEARRTLGRVVEQARADKNAEYERMATEALNELR